MTEAQPALRILLVEDEALILMAAVDTLSELGHVALPTSNGAAALRIAGSEEAIDLMIVDINLPDIDGKQLGAEVRRLRPGLPIVFATGYRMEIPPDLAESGPTTVLGKPYWASDLAKAIRAVI